MPQVEYPDAVLSNGAASGQQPLNAEGKPICGVVRRGKRPCQQSAGAGTDHLGFGTCKWHVGMTASGDIDAARREVAAYVEGMRQLGKVGPEVSPEDAIMQEVARSQAAVEYYDEQVAKITSDPDADVGSAANTKVIWQWNEQRRLLTAVSNLVIRAGLARRSIEIQEMQASAVLAAILAVLSSPEMDLDSERIQLAKRMIASQLRDLTTTPEQRAAMMLEVANSG